MRVRYSILWLCAAILVLVVLFIWLAERPAESPSTPARESTTTADSTTDDAEPASSPPGSYPGKTSPGTGASTAVPLTKAEQAKQALGTLNDEAVVLYGKVVDQFDSPVARATVKGSIQVNDGTRIGTDRISLSTDEGGCFTISGYTGKSLGISVERSGYVMATTNTRFVYSLLWSEAERHNPDPNNPVVLKMWKLQGAEPLSEISKDYRLPFTSTPLHFDLLKREVTSQGGDLQINISRAPGSLSKRSPGDWSIKLVPINGGIMESDFHAAQVTFEAPQDGYQRSYHIEMKRDDPAWFDGITRTFFLKSRNGQIYSKFYLEFGINRKPDERMWIRFCGVANTNASRNWEADALGSK